MAYPPQVCFLGAKTQQKPPLSMQRGPCEITIILFLLEAALLSELGGMNYSALAEWAPPCHLSIPCPPPPTLLSNSLDLTWGCCSTTRRHRGGGPPNPAPPPPPASRQFPSTFDRANACSQEMCDYRTLVRLCWLSVLILFH